MYINNRGGGLPLQLNLQLFATKVNNPYNGSLNKSITLSYNKESVAYSKDNWFIPVKTSTNSIIWTLNNYSINTLFPIAYNNIDNINFSWYPDENDIEFEFSHTDNSDFNKDLNGKLTFHTPIGSFITNINGHEEYESDSNAIIVMVCSISGNNSLRSALLSTLGQKTYLTYVSN